VVVNVHMDLNAVFVKKQRITINNNKKKNRFEIFNLDQGRLMTYIGGFEFYIHIAWR